MTNLRRTGASLTPTIEAQLGRTVIRFDDDIFRSVTPARYMELFQREILPEFLKIPSPRSLTPAVPLEATPRRWRLFGRR